MSLFCITQTSLKHFLTHVEEKQALNPQVTKAYRSSCIQTYSSALGHCAFSFICAPEHLRGGLARTNIVLPTLRKDLDVAPHSVLPLFFGHRRCKVTKSPGRNERPLVNNLSGNTCSTRTSCWNETRAGGIFYVLGKK